MLAININQLRKLHNMTQEEVAAKIKVSRQTVVKWENGEATPDVYSCSALAELFNVTVDDLINHSVEDSGTIVPPKGKYFFGSVTVGEQGEIEIPEKAREVFHIKSGDKLLVLGDEDRGIGIIHQHDLMNFVGALGVAPNIKKKKDKK